MKRYTLWLMLLVALGTGLLPYSAAPLQAANFVPVTVTIMRIIEVSCDDGGFTYCPDDYYAKVNIAGQGFQRSPKTYEDEGDVSPYWQFTRQVDRDIGSAILIDIEVWDEDDASGDDELDISAGDNALHLTVDINTGIWNGEVAQNVGFTSGGHAKVFFDIAVQSNGDIDSDGIPDGVERFGVRDSNGAVVADMAVLGADPCRKTIAVEIDFMNGAADGHTHRPQAAAITQAINAFNAAPVAAVIPCPYVGFPAQPSGVNLVVDVSNAVAEQAVLSFGNGYEIDRNGSFNAARRPYFHYSLWVHDQAAGDSSSGLCCSGGTPDFLVSLGSWAGQNGTSQDQAGTFMHELGHALGLRHGGGDDVNCKPNYLSIMNYPFQTRGLTNATTGANFIDYSRAALPALNEGALIENAGVSDGPLFTRWTDPTGTTHTGRGDGALDWTWDTPQTINAGTVAVDLNADPGITRCGVDASGNPTPSPGETLNGYDDWANLRYQAVLSPNKGGVAASPPELTFQDSQRIDQLWRTFFTADLNISSVTVVNPPIRLRPGHTAAITLQTLFGNQGSSDADPLEVQFNRAVVADPGVTVTTTAPDDRELSLHRAEEQTIEEDMTIVCATPGRHQVAFISSLSLKSPAFSDPDTANNHAQASFTVDCTTRATDGLAALYYFDEGAGSTVHDVSGVGEPLDIQIENPAAVQWAADGLQVLSPTTLASAPATKVTAAISETNEVTLEAWVWPDGIVAEEDATIAALATSPVSRSLELVQKAADEADDGRYEARLRTSRTSARGQSFRTPRGVVTAGLTHLVVTRDSLGITRLYVNNVAQEERTIRGELPVWDDQAPLTLASELGGLQPWLGKYQLVALYNRALSPAEVSENYRSGPSGDGVVAVTTDLQSLYNFDEGSGTIVHDTSGAAEPIDLSIRDITATRWVSGGLVITASTLLTSTTAATRTTQVMTATNEVSIEAWVAPADVPQQSLARLVTLSGDSVLRNVELLQEQQDRDDLPRYTVRLRTSETLRNGKPPLKGPKGSVVAGLQHVVYTRDALGFERLYVNGVEVARETSEGTFANWDASYYLVLANTPSGDRPWLGEYQRLALYNRAVSPAEVIRHFKAGPSVPE